MQRWVGKDYSEVPIGKGIESWGEWYYPGGPPDEDMATALAYFYSEEGFVIAADGRNTLVSRGGRSVSSDKTQKIFPVCSAARQAALSFVGRTSVYDREDQQVAFDFIQEFLQAAGAFGEGTAGEFLCNVGELVHIRMKAVIQDVGIGPLPRRGGRIKGNEHRILDVHLDGYFGGKPQRAGGSFYHIDQEIFWDDNSRTTLICPPPYYTEIIGSHVIAHLLIETDDPRLALYRTPAFQRVLAAWKDRTARVSLADGIEAARNYIGACSDRDLRPIDAEVCEGIGGRIHIATITPAEGLRWVEGFEPADQK